MDFHAAIGDRAAVFDALEDIRNLRVQAYNDAIRSLAAEYGTPVADQYSAFTSAWASAEWRFARDQRVTVNSWLQCNTNDAAIATALAGSGLTRVLHYQVGPALLEGRLQIVLADYEEPPLPVHVLHPEGRHATAKVRAFVDLAVSRLR